jgi:putative FmdB family regulatory protein
MPTYVYRREDGSTFEVNQKITEDPLDECPETGQPVERILTGSPGVVGDSSDDRPAGGDGAPACSGPLCGM